MPDPRATQLWDDEKLASQLFADQEGFLFGSIAYDIYYLYSPESRWDFKPSSLVSSGYPGIGKSNQLREDVGRLLGSTLAGS